MRPTSRPSRQPTTQPLKQPTSQPLMRPSVQPSRQPTLQPFTQPTTQPTAQPTLQPSRQPVDQPTSQPSRQPSSQPYLHPTSQPSRLPSSQPSTQPTTQPRSQPTVQPSRQPIRQPTSQPTRQPQVRPTGQPSRQPTSQPSRQPARAPSRRPSSQPSRRPSSQPTSEPSTPYPFIRLPLNVTVGQKYAEVHLRLGFRGGTSYCAALPRNISVPSVLQVVLNGFSVPVVDAPSHVNIKLTGLAPATDYDVYCYSEGSDGSSMSLAQTVSTLHRISTKCCGSVTFSQSVPQIPAGVSGLTTPFQISLNSQPHVNMQVFVSIVRATGMCFWISPGIKPNATVSPSTFQFNRNSPSLSGSFVVQGTSGCYVLYAFAIGGQTYYNVSQPLTIRNSSTPSPAPQLLSAVFSSDGQTVATSFDISSDQGANAHVPFSYSSIFPCSAVLSFPGVVSASCTWASPTRLILALTNSTTTLAPLLTVGDKIVLLANVLRAPCVPGLVCRNPYTTSMAVIATAPAIPLVPSVSLSAPSKVAVCDGISLDPTSSTGSGGRKWKQIKWSVTAKGDHITAKNISALASYLNKFGVDNLVYIPNKFLSPGFFTISVSLKNFFNKTSTTMTTIQVTNSGVTPSVSIAGPTKIAQYRWQSLSLFVVVNASSCSGNTATPSFTYTWTAFKQKIVNNMIVLSPAPQISSAGMDPRYFNLPAFSMNVLTDYAVQVSVALTDQPNRTLATATVLVQVGRSDTKAVIAGGSSRSASMLSPVVIDASQSYDLDFPTGSSLAFAWSCSQISPIFGAACGFLLPSQPTLTLNSAQLLPGTINVTVFVTNSEKKVSSSSVLLSLVDKFIPLVGIVSSKTVFNPTDTIILTAFVNSSVPTTMTWNSTSVALKTIAVTPLIKNSPSGYSLFQLGIQANSLSAGVSYTFQFVATTFSGGQSFSSFSIAINAPPKGGQVVVAPTSGVALNTTFRTVTQKWIDSPSDYPLSYILSYAVSPTAAQVIIKSKDTVSYASSFIGQGLEAYGYQVISSADAIDIYGCSARTTSYVTVKPAQLSPSQLQSAATTAIASALTSNNPTAVFQAIGAVSQAVNAVNCSVPRPCANIGRQDCSFTPNTCGGCLTGYLGPSGNSNSPCGLVSQLKKVGEACVLPSQCITGACVNSVCADPPKKCLNDCSGKGLCVYTNINTTVVPTCTTTNPYCSAACRCYNASYGADCSLTYSQLQGQIATRETLCIGLYASMAAQDVTSDVVLGRASSISMVLQDVTQISDVALRYCASALVETVRRNPHETAAIATQAVEAFSHVLAGGSRVPPALLANVSQAITLLTGAVQSTIAVGQSAEITTGNVNMRISLMDANDVSAAAISPPQSEFNAFVSQPVPALKVAATSSSSGAVGVMTMQYTNNPHGKATNTTVLGVSVKSYPVDAQGNLATTAVNSNAKTVLVLPNAAPVDYVTKLPNGTVTCRRGTKYKLTVQCPNNHTLSYLCNGTKVAIPYTCPGQLLLPRCITWDGSEFSEDPSCTVTSFNALSTTCLCGGTTSSPTSSPTFSPTQIPTLRPSQAPTPAPTSSPTYLPGRPTRAPTATPTTAPTYVPGRPTPKPTPSPTLSPTKRPTSVPSYALGSPTPLPSLSPTAAPTASPTCLLGAPATLNALLPSTVPGLKFGSWSDLTTVILTSGTFGSVHMSSGSTVNGVPFLQSASRSSALWLLACQDDGYVKMVQLQVTVVGDSTFFRAVAAAYVSSSLSTASLTTSKVMKFWAESSSYDYQIVSVTATGCAVPISLPTTAPTSAPSAAPSYALGQPTPKPTVAPSCRPTVAPTNSPTLTPSARPTIAPSRPSAAPSPVPSSSPTKSPTSWPTFAAGKPTPSPSAVPTISPTLLPVYINIVQVSHLPSFDFSSIFNIFVCCALDVYWYYYSPVQYRAQQRFDHPTSRCRFYRIQHTSRKRDCN